jgi:hypothetical protein
MSLPRRVITADQCFSLIFPMSNQRSSSVVRAGISTKPGSAQKHLRFLTIDAVLPLVLDAFARVVFETQLRLTIRLNGIFAKPHM